MKSAVEKPAVEEPNKMPRQLHIFVLIDALGWTFVENRDFLSDLLLYRRPLRTVLGFSSGAIPTILTGVAPSQHAHWNLFYYDPDGSPFRWMRFFRFLPDALLDNRYTRKILKEMGRHVLGLGSLFECCVSPAVIRYFNWVEKKNIYAAGGITGAPSIFDELAAKGVDYRAYSYRDCSDEEIVGRARADIDRGDASFLFLYLSEMDMFLHMHCVDEAKLEQKLQWYDAKLRGLFEFARERFPDATFTITSDHGMTPVRKQYDLMRDVESAGLKMPDDYLAVYDSTMARFWFFSDRARPEIVARLSESPAGRILSDDELRQLGVLFEDRRFGELIFLLHPGWLLSRSDFNGPQWAPVGMHGYHPDDPYSDAIFLTNRRPSYEPTTIADMHDVMCAGAGAPEREALR